MPRIRPVDPASATGEAKTVLDAVKAQIGAVPNILAAFAQSPQVLKGYLAMNDALGRGALPAPLREQIAVAVAGANACDYCASAHTALGKKAGVDKAELVRNLAGRSEVGRVQAVLSFVSKVVAERGHVSDADLQALRDAGYGDGEIVEIVAHVGVNIFTNYFNHIAQTEIDFPVVSTAAVKAA